MKRNSERIAVGRRNEIDRIAKNNAYVAEDIGCGAESFFSFFFFLFPRKHIRTTRWPNDKTTVLPYKKVKRRQNKEKVERRRNKRVSI